VIRAQTYPIFNNQNLTPLSSHISPTGNSMKLAIFSLLFGSAAAFAPSSHSGAVQKSALHETKVGLKKLYVSTTSYILFLGGSREIT